MEDPDNNCKCIKIIGDLEDIKWKVYPRAYHPSPGYLSLGDWTQNPHIWLHYVESADGSLITDDVLISTDTRYWNIHDVQRYFLADEHCNKVLFTYQYPNLRMSTPFGDTLWRANTAMKLPSELYMKELRKDLEITLKDNLQLVSFENLLCKRLEGVRLLQQLACFNAKSLKYLFLWEFVLPNENPILVNYSYIKGSGTHLSRPETKKCFIRCLGELRQLRILALEYAHIADGTGGALISLLPVLKRPHFRLQLMCRETNIPGRTDTALGAGGFCIPDTAWRRVTILCPDLYVMMVFFSIRDYDNIKRFLTPSISLREVHWQLGIDLKIRQRQHSDISCFFRHIAFRYADILTTLSIHQWRFVIFPLRAVFEMMPHLVRFFYVGCVEDEIDLKRLLKIIACGVCDKLKQLKIQIQDEEKKRSYWENVVHALAEEYSDIMTFYDINFCFSIYKK